MHGYNTVYVVGSMCYRSNIKSHIVINNVIGISSSDNVLVSNLMVAVLANT